MTHYLRHYDPASRQAADEQAIDDIREYLSMPQWDALVALTQAPDVTIPQINMAMAFAGISGRPFHAFCRRFLLDKYRAWMADGDDGVPTDAEGFRLEIAATHQGSELVN